MDNPLLLCHEIQLPRQRKNTCFRTDRLLSHRNCNKRCIVWEGRIFAFLKPPPTHAQKPPITNCHKSNNITKCVTFRWAYHMWGWITRVGVVFNIEDMEFWIVRVAARTLQPINSIPLITLLWHAGYRIFSVFITHRFYFFLFFMKIFSTFACSALKCDTQYLSNLLINFLARLQAEQEYAPTAPWGRWGPGIALNVTQHGKNFLIKNVIIISGTYALYETVCNINLFLQHYTASTIHTEQINCSTSGTFLLELHSRYTIEFLTPLNGFNFTNFLVESVL